MTPPADLAPLRALVEAVLSCGPRAPRLVHEIACGCADAAHGEGWEDGRARELAVWEGSLSQRAAVAREALERTEDRLIALQRDPTGHLYRCARVNGQWQCARDCPGKQAAAQAREIEALAAERDGLQAEVERVHHNERAFKEQYHKTISNQRERLAHFERSVIDIKVGLRKRIEEEQARAASAEADVMALAEALPSPDKLDLLADWIDLKFPGDGNPEVQRSLRMWAARARAAFARDGVRRAREEGR